MTAPQVRRIDGDRLHLQHGPIDLIIGADGPRDAAFDAAITCFAPLLAELAGELPQLRAQEGAVAGTTAQRMAAALDVHKDVFATRMAAVAGAVADTVLDAMRKVGIPRGYVNNGGDIAVHLTQGQSFKLGMADHDGAPLGTICLNFTDEVGGIATSGRHGRSLSRGIADSVTVLAGSAAAADVAATLIANAVDLPDHPAITRLPAHSIVPDSDLGARLIPTDVGQLQHSDIERALNAGQICAQKMLDRGIILGAALFLNKTSRIVGTTGIDLIPSRSISYA